MQAHPYLSNACRILLILFLVACQSKKPLDNIDSQTLAANPEVAAYMEQFEGRGDQADDSSPTPPEEVLQSFHFPSDLAVDLIASEPLIHQPVELNFDHRGRLWVVQYSQYPFPAGVKITGYDYHLRAQFDQIPAPPPEGVKGADKISVLEDTDGDGVYDKATDAIRGLNIATSVTWGRERIWVLNPPYLLAFPDPDGDGIPNGDPKVHLKGFGLEDTHAVANSLRWGPDGWLYGAQGSTCIATINSSVSKDVHFKGQAIWRYHPETEVFEVYAEGGGNTFHVEIDDKGRIYSGHNGAGARGPYYKQGGYYPKNWGKHGALTNPYAFGYLPHMALEGDKLRFTHAFLRYGGASLPETYHDKLIGINPLHNYVQISSFESEGSTFRNEDTGRMLETDDHWFRPVDIKAGPDGGVYLADWYDSRLSHIDPRDTWHRNSGRVYRIRNLEASPHISTEDLSIYSNDQLVELLSHPNRWFRQQAQRQFGDRKDTSVLPRLRLLLEQSRDQLALEALWAIHLSGGFDESVAGSALRHIDPYVRLWAVRLLGDQKKASHEISSQLALLANEERHPEVLSQLTASAKRFPAETSLPMIQELVSNQICIQDDEIPLQIWWALEDKAETDREAVLDLFMLTSFWQSPIVQHSLLARLMQRYIMAGGQDNFASASRLLELAPDSKSHTELMAGLLEGLRGQQHIELPSRLAIAIESYQNENKNSGLALGLRQGKAEAISQVLEEIKAPDRELSTTLTYLQLLGETHPPEASPTLLDLVKNTNHSTAIRQASLYALGGYANEEIGEQIIAWYPDRLRADPALKEAALELLGTRTAWTRRLLTDIHIRKQILAEDIPTYLVRQYRLHEDAKVQQLANQLWPDIGQMSTKEKQKEMDRLASLLRSGSGDSQSGKALFQAICGTCHRLFEEGGEIGPDLTAYERSNISYLLAHTIDPSAEIREGYVNYLAQTQKGQTYSGIMVHRSGGIIRLKTMSGQEIDLPDNQLASIQAQATSIMPEQLLTALSDEQVRDLFAYLMKEDN